MIISSLLRIKVAMFIFDPVAVCEVISVILFQIPRVHLQSTEMLLAI